MIISCLKLLLVHIKFDLRTVDLARIADLFSHSHERTVRGFHGFGKCM